VNTTPTTILVLFSIPVLGYFFSTIFFVWGLRLRKPGRNTINKSVSVIIAARDEETVLTPLLDGLVNQTYPENQYEVVIVDDQSTDNTAEIGKIFASNYSNISYLRIDETPKNYGPKKWALNQGIKASSGEIILCIDADCIPKPTWIEVMVSYFTQNVGMVVGYAEVVVENQKSLLQRWQAFDFLGMMAAGEGALNWGIPLAATGQNLGFTREAFDAVGGYSQIARGMTGDDVLLLQLIRNKTDYDIDFAGNPGAYNRTYPHHTIMGLLRQRTRWAADAPTQIRTDFLFFLYLLVVFLMYSVILGGFIYAFIQPDFWSIFVSGLGLKLLGEIILLRYAVTIYQREELFSVFPLWTLLQIPYIIIVGVAGLFVDYSWKGRRRR